MRVRRTAAVVAALATGLLVAPLAPAQAAGKGPSGVVLYAEGTRIARFDADRPNKAKRIGDIVGFSGDTALVGIDRRVQNQRLYGVGDQGGIYVISPTSGKARKVGQLSVTLEGTHFGVDFNPAANALRVVSDTGQNLRQPFGTEEGPTGSTVADGTLNYLGVTAPGITAAAYTNNDLSADTATTLFDLDSTLDQVAVQSPANSGSLVATGKVGRDITGGSGFDIYSDLKADRTVTNHGYAVIGARLFTVDLLNGRLHHIGKFSKSGATDIALTLDK